MNHIALIEFFALAACATETPPAVPDRHLTAEEDEAMAEMRDKCDALGGCAIVPADKFEKMRQSLKACHQEHSL